MNWTKIPTNLLVDRIPDKELVAIVKYQLLWAELEYQPSDETVLRYLTPNQLKLINHWLNTIETQVLSDLKSVNKHRTHQKTNYQKKQQVKEKTDSQTDSQTDSSLTGNRLDNIKKENTKEKKQEENKNKVHNALEIFGNTFKATDAVVGVFDRPDGTTREGIQIKNPRLMAFVRQRFDQKTLNRVSEWVIDHNQRGHTYNATSLLKLLCKFQSNVESTINFNNVQSEYLTFEFKGE